VTDDEIRARALFFTAAKEKALTALANGGADAGVTRLIDELRSHPAFRAHQRHLALLWLDARQTVVPGGAGAVRQWILDLAWPEPLGIEPGSPNVPASG
jgi:hypothetical protein